MLSWINFCLFRWQRTASLRWQRTAVIVQFFAVISVCLPLAINMQLLKMIRNIKLKSGTIWSRILGHLGRFEAWDVLRLGTF
jgi:hypothetical protein